MRFRRRRLAVARCDEATNRWADLDAVSEGADRSERNELTVATFNIWFNAYFARQRYLAIAELLSRDAPDVMVFQEVTPDALNVFLAQPWIREHYARAAVTADGLDYGMLMLSRLPVERVTYSRLPTRLARGFLAAELTINDRPQMIVSVHLESGKRSARLRARQLQRIFRACRGVEDVVVLGDFNMRDAENERIDAAYCDLWPALRPGDAGFTEDTSINHMRFDSKNKHRHVRFDRVLLKGSAWAGEEIDLLGTEPISAAHPRVFPSDHFGVRCRFTARPVAAPDVRQRARLWGRLRSAWRNAISS